ncbi:DAK2 domain-containing protein [Nocardioides ferulae]|uniref:DAK2 domain-containing protein n=1 Tax=Nocardioides ferulae TaxID=2340821 RepID=UPI000EB3AAC2|nr:DAK2 domain-containing protein [Nocardioides ferulae]
MEVVPGSTFALPVVLRFVDVAVDALAEAREEIDALNVYPVPDGDTGTNMFLTMSAARDAVREVTGPAGDGATLPVALAAFSRGALMGARGNSGVILSEMLGAIARRLASAGPEEEQASVMADALHRATEASYAAVGTPVEGTMLTVLRAASDAALLTVGSGRTPSREVFSAAAAAAREALRHTPEQLRTLAEAGVVDAGGRGITVILDAAETVLTGRRPSPVKGPIGTHHIPIPARTDHLEDDLTPDGPAYEVMYLLDADDARIPRLRAALRPLGDSLVVVGGEGLWNVHVHVDDVGAAIEAGIEAGRPHRVRVTHFADQIARQHARQHPGRVPERRHGHRSGRRVVAVSAGPGLAGLFEGAGAVVVEGGPGRRPSTGQLLEAIMGCGACEVVVLPNDPDSVRVARIAASTAENDPAVEGDIRVAVIPTQAQVQGLAALAVHEPGRSFDQDVLEMTATSRHARHGAVTIAARQAMTMAGPCEPGDVLGVVAGDFVIVGDDLDEVAAAVVERLLAPGGELVTVVAGSGAEGAHAPGRTLDAASLAERCGAQTERRHPGVDVVVYDGGQERYPLLLSVE